MVSVWNSTRDIDYGNEGFSCSVQERMAKWVLLGYLVPAGRTLGHWVGDIALVIWRVDHVGPTGVAEPDSVLVRRDLVIDEYCSRDGWWCYWSLRVYFGYDGDSGWPVGCNWCVGSGEECWIVAVVSECVGDDLRA